jgi:hypothetical protein
MAEKTGKEGHRCSYLWKSMKGSSERACALCLTTYTTKDVRQRSFMNHAWDHVQRANNHKWFSTMGTRRRPHC